MSVGSSRFSRRRLLATAVAGMAAPLLARVDAAGATASGDSYSALGSQVVGLPDFSNHVGWAYTIDWMITPDEIRADMQRMRDEGCTSVYIGHDNPAGPGWGSAEPGLSFAVWYELEQEGARAYEAQTKLALIHAAIQAAEEAGLQVVLPIDYQMQQGPTWSAQHHDQLAHDPLGGTLVNGGNPIASPYSEVFREHKAAYYEWVRDEVLAGYEHIVAINLGDEPLGCDYSPHAMAAFAARYGREWAQAATWEKGEFQSGVVADYAIWSAWQWESMQPGMRTMFTFHIERFRPFFPNFDRIFHQTPTAFIISADTHLHDAPAIVPLTAQDRNLLFDLCRRLGLWSHQSGRDVLLWHSVNHWGLSTAGIPEALDNHAVVLNATREAGGRVGKTMAWARNIRFQGLYRHEGSFDHVDPDEMVAAITPRMVAELETLSSRAEPAEHHVLYFPSRLISEGVGRDRPRFEWDHREWTDHQGYDFAANRYVTMTDGPALEEARRRGWTITDLIGGDASIALPRLYYLPSDVRAMAEERVWFGASTHAALQSVQRAADALRGRGLDWLQEAGLYKGSVYVAGMDGNFHERVVFERVVLHAVDARFESTLALRDLANGRIELGEGNRLFAELPMEMLERIAGSPIIGDAGSLAPALTMLRPYLTLNGENHDEERTGQPVGDAIDADGVVGAAPTGLDFGISYVLYDNGHNIPNVLLAEITKRYGPATADWWPRIGRPIGRAFWMQSMVGAAGLQWVLTQPFERAMLAYHPVYAHLPAWAVQGALIGNLFLRAVTGDVLPYRAEYHEMRW